MEQAHCIALTGVALASWQVTVLFGVGVVLPWKGGTACAEFFTAFLVDNHLGILPLVAGSRGFVSFFQGNTANVIKVMPESGVKFWAYDAAKAVICADPRNTVVVVSTSSREELAAAFGSVPASALQMLDQVSVEL